MVTFLTTQIERIKNRNNRILNAAQHLIWHFNVRVALFGVTQLLEAWLEGGEGLKAYLMSYSSWRHVRSFIFPDYAKHHYCTTVR